MKAVFLFYLAGMGFLTGFVLLAFKLAWKQSGEISGPWFFLGILASWSGSALLDQERRLKAIEEKITRILEGRTSEPEGAPDRSSSTPRDSE